MPLPLPILLSVAARILGGLTSERFDLVLRWIESEAAEHPDSPGWQKAERVMERVQALVGKAKDKHIIRTVVQLAFQVARIKKLI